MKYLIILAFILAFSACTSVLSQSTAVATPTATLFPTPTLTSTLTPTHTPMPTSNPTVTPSPTPFGGGKHILYRVAWSGSKSAGVSIVNGDGNSDPEFRSPDIPWQTNPTWSPDGSKIAVVSDYNYSGGGELYVVEPDGSYLKLTGISFGSYSWSPDGSQIAVSRVDEDLNREIFVIDISGENLEQLTDFGLSAYGPAWSPDGSRITFIVSDPNQNDDPEIYIINLVDKNIRQLTDNEINEGAPKWSPDGKYIAFQAKQDEYLGMYVIDADGNNLRNVSNFEANDTWCLTWSPNWKHILFVSKRDGNPEIYVVDTDGSNLRNLTNNEANDGTPLCSLDWSPDGTQIVFASDRSNYSPLGSEIYIMNIDGSNVHRLVEGNGQMNFFSPIWQSSP